MKFFTDLLEPHVQFQSTSIKNLNQKAVNLAYLTRFLAFLSRRFKTLGNSVLICFRWVHGTPENTCSTPVNLKGFKSVRLSLRNSNNTAEGKKWGCKQVREQSNGIIYSAPFQQFAQSQRPYQINYN